jgi:quercetin dioxygenase-like cupin family protein
MSNLAELGTMPEILRIEKEILAMPQVELPIEHYQIDGVYARSMFIPAGTILTGKIHNFESIAILAKGRIRITNGTESYIISEGHIMVDKPGVKRLGYAETDVIFITVHRTDNTEIEAIEKELVSATFEEYQQQLLLGAPSWHL